MDTAGVLRRNPTRDRLCRQYSGRYEVDLRVWDGLNLTCCDSSFLDGCFPNRLCTCIFVKFNALAVYVSAMNYYFPNSVSAPIVPR
jgi:hypothetical protein